MNQLLKCGDNNKPVYVITYLTNDSYLVCENCLKLPHWSRNIKSKELFNDSLN